LATAVLAVLPARAGVADIKPALQDDEDCRGLSAFEAFVGLVDAGDPVAARIATLRVRLEPALYGRPFAASNAEAELWRDIAAQALHRDRQGPQPRRWFGHRATGS
jgi:hypothetical protein